MCPICPRRHPAARNKHGARITQCAPNGPAPAPVLMVLDSPDDNANRQGLAAVGKLGREIFDCYLPAAGLNRDQVRVTYAMRCQRVDGDPPTLEEARACSEYWVHGQGQAGAGEMEQTRPQVVIAAGPVAAKVAVGREESGRMDVPTYHGQLYGRVEYARAPELNPHVGAPAWWWGFTPPVVFGAPRGAVHLIPTNSPASGFAGSDLMTHVLGDYTAIRPILECVGRGQYPHALDQFPFPTYREITTPAEVANALHPGYSATRGRWVAVDTETDGMDGPPWCLSFSTAPGTGFVIPADALPAIQMFNRMVHPSTDSFRRVLLHNALFDVDVLRRMGVEGFRWRDTMHTAYQLGDQPQGLKPLAWRLAGMEMVDYSEVVRGPSIPAVRAWGERVALAVAAAIPTKQPRKKLALEPHHKFWKKHAGLLGRRMVKLEEWELAQLRPAESGGDFPSPWDWWEEREPNVRRALTLFGGGVMPAESIVHVPRPRAIEYAARDADATLRTWFALRRLVRQLARRVPAMGDRPRKTW